MRCTNGFQVLEQKIPRFLSIAFMIHVESNISHMVYDIYDIDIFSVHV